jgi:hypothetical protein
MKLLSWVKGTLAKGDRSEKEVSPEPQPEPVVAQASVLDTYVKTSPSPQTALDIFQGEWGSALLWLQGGDRLDSIQLFL